MSSVLWPRTVAVFANTDVLADLDPEARGWLTAAAENAETWAAQHAGDAEAEQMESACRGARIATATPDQLAALRAVTELVYAAMRSDAGQAATLARIEDSSQGCSRHRSPTSPSGARTARGTRTAGRSRRSR